MFFLDKLYLTKEQYDSYKARLDELIHNELPRNSEEIAAAIAQGDLSENAEYENAKEEQAKLNAEIAKIKNVLNNATLIKENDNFDFVEVGHKVTIEFLSSDEKIELKTGTQETITLTGVGDGVSTIGIDSPIGKELLGKEVGDLVIVDAPIGELTYKIIDIN